MKIILPKNLPVKASLLFILVFSMQTLAFGELDDPKKVPEKPAPKAVTPALPKVSEITDFHVDSIASEADTAEKKVKKNYLSENNEIMITISNPKDFLLSRPADNSQLILFANGFPLKGMNTEYFTAIGRQYLNDTTKHWPAYITVPFVFNRDTSNEEAWNMIFKLTKWNKHKITVKMALGWSGMFPLNVRADKPTSLNTVTILLYRPWIFKVFSLVYLLLLIGFAYLCSTSGLIRDPDTVNGTGGPFSLSQTQLAFWTVIVIGGFCYLWLLTGQADAINNSILLLLGISGGTTGTATLIDYYKKTSLQNNMAAAAAAGTPVTATNTVKQHRNFIKDILSDGINMSVQRAQTALWNLVLGLYFLWYVVTNKSMPEFNNTLLVLAGVSSVLYVGSKGTENPQTKPAAAVTTPADVSNSAQHEF